MAVIKYKFVFEDKSEKVFEVDLDRPPAHLQPNIKTETKWTELDFNKCEKCPFNSQKVKRCPTAVDIEHIAVEFKDIKSTSIVKTWVQTENRYYFKECDAQTGLRALSGLVMATSACPILSKMKPMAYYHLPFASIEETVFRAVSSYLLKQYFLSKEGKKTDWELNEFIKFYDDLQAVNNSFMNRIKMASKADANLNTIVALSSVSSLIALAFDESIVKIKERYSS